MDFLENLFITKVTHVFKTKFEKSKKTFVENRENYGICFIEEGEVIFYHDGKSYFCDANRVVVLPEGAAYSWECSNNCHGFIINFSCTEESKTKKFHEIMIKDSRIYSKDLYVLEKCYSLQNIIGSTEYLSHLYKIITGLNKENSAPACPKLNGVFEYMNKHLWETELDNRILAEHFNLSISYFRSLFKKTYNIAPMDYLRNLRIEKAKEMLLYSDFSVTLICEKCGFSNLYSFSRTFKTNVGISPFNFRNKNKISIM